MRAGVARGTRGDGASHGARRGASESGGGGGGGQGGGGENRGRARGGGGGGRASTHRPGAKTGAPEMDHADAAVDGGVHASGRERHARVDVATRPTPRIRGARERGHDGSRRSRLDQGHRAATPSPFASGTPRTPGSARAGSASTVGGTRGEGAAGDAEWGGETPVESARTWSIGRGGGGGRGCWEPRVGWETNRRRTAGATIFSILHRNARPRWCSSVVVSSRGSYWYAVFGTLFACGEDGAETARSRVLAPRARPRRHIATARGVS